MGIWEWEYGNGNMEMGVWEWEYRNGSMGRGVWEWEYGNVGMKAWVGKGNASNHVYGSAITNWFQYLVEVVLTSTAAV